MITWLRSGAGPEVDEVTFELADDAINYSPLGGGTRVAGGWQLSGLTLPSNQNVFLRARGYFRTGCYSGSGSIVESVREVFLPPSGKAVMVDPPRGSIFTSSAVTFTWSVGPEATEYYLQVGTTPGGQELYSASESLNLSATVLALPTNGSTVHARLWSNVGGAWQYNDYTYTACTGCMATKAAMTTPAPGSALSSSMEVFWWSTSLGSECYLQVGTTLGGQQIYSAGQGRNLRCRNGRSRGQKQLRDAVACVRTAGECGSRGTRLDSSDSQCNPSASRSFTCTKSIVGTLRGRTTPWDEDGKGILRMDAGVGTACPRAADTAPAGCNKKGRVVQW